MLYKGKSLGEIALTGLLVVLLAGCKKSVEDKYEPNDEITDAAEITVGEDVKALISPDGDVDYFKLTTANTPVAGGVLIFSLNPFPLTPWITVYNADRAEIENWYEHTEGANLYAWVDAKPGATYYVKVTDFGEGSSEISYILIVDYIGVNDPHEPDNDFDHATSIEIGATDSAYLFAGEPEGSEDYGDYYKVTTTVAGSLKARLTNTPTDIAPYIRIYDSERSEIADDYDGTCGAYLTVTESVSAGDYYILVSPFGDTPYDWYGEGETPASHTKTLYHLKVTLE
ncbi:MAG: hypothetical protein U9R01_03195 [candidate division WOR-3 bacterium]|nr:hypothetical protein [candidate division WOR-3 bacterium]